MVEVRCEWEESATLGEGPVWVERESAVYWVDIVQRRILRYGVEDESTRQWTFDEQVTSLGVREQGGFVASIRGGFGLVDLEAEKIQPIQMPEAHLPGNRFNDGKVDLQGRFWAGSMDDAQVAESGVLYRLDPDLSVHRMDDGYVITNGPTFSPDGATMYHTNTRRKTIYAFDLDSFGGISNKREFVRLQRTEQGSPDGMTVDEDGCLWLAHFRGARVTRFSPDGDELQVVELPVPNVTSCTFGGPDLETLYITTARYHLDDVAIDRYPLSGSLFSCRPGVRGLPTAPFRG